MGVLMTQKRQHDYLDILVLHVFVNVLLISFVGVEKGQTQMLNTANKKIEQVTIGEPFAFYCSGWLFKKMITNNTYVDLLTIYRNSEAIYVHDIGNAFKKTKSPPMSFSSEGITSKVASNLMSVHATAVIPRATKAHEGTYKCKYNYRTPPQSQMAFSLTLEAVELNVYDSCQDGWVYAEETGACLKVFLHEENWSDARHFCSEKHQGDLVVITSKSYNEFVFSLMGKDMGNNYWIGYSDIHEKSMFKWLDSTSLSRYNNWLPDNPVTYEGEYACAFMGRHPTGKWATTVCQDRKKIVCERDKHAKSAEWESKYGFFRIWVKPYITAAIIAVLVVLSSLVSCYYGIKIGFVPKVLNPVARTILGGDIFHPPASAHSKAFIPRGGTAIVYESTLENTYQLGREVSSGSDSPIDERTSVEKEKESIEEESDTLEDRRASIGSGVDRKSLSLSKRDSGVDKSSLAQSRKSSVADKKSITQSRKSSGADGKSVASETKSRESSRKSHGSSKRSHGSLRKSVASMRKSAAKLSDIQSTSTS